MREPWEFAEERDRKQEKWLQQRPICDCCGEHIQDESYHEIFGKKICDSCLEESAVHID